MNVKKITTQMGLVAGALLVSATAALPDTLTFGFNLSGCTTSTAPCPTTASTAFISPNNYLTGLNASVNSLLSSGGGVGSGAGTGNNVNVITGLVLSNLNLSILTANGGVDQFALTGSINGGTTQTLLAYNEAFSFATGAGANSTATFGAITSLTSINSTFAQYLGVSSSSTESLAGSGYQVTLSLLNTSNTNNVSSINYGLSLTNVATATPEPASFLLFGTGLFCAGLVARRRGSKKVS